MQFCPEPGCSALVSSGWCPAHTRHQRGGAAYAAVHRLYTSARWLRLRAEVLRAEPFCRACQAQGRRTLTAEIDHVRKHEGDPGRFWDRSNLQGLCKACHTAKTARGG